MSIPCQLEIIPAYFYPADNDDSDTSWSQMTSIAPGIVILNPNSGPTASADPTYVAAVNNLRDAGVKVIGYVYTSYSERDTNDVEADVDLYYAQYNIDGIFFDETTTAESNLTYYRNIATYVYEKGPENLVVLNPGLFPAESYVEIANITVVFESSASQYINHYAAPEYVDYYPSTKFAHMVHTTSSSQLQQVTDLSYERNAGYVYVTDDVMPNPYDVLPTYLDAELEDLSALCSAAARPASLGLPVLFALFLLVLWQLRH